MYLFPLEFVISKLKNIASDDYRQENLGGFILTISYKFTSNADSPCKSAETLTCCVVYLSLTLFMTPSSVPRSVHRDACLSLISRNKGACDQA